jgi:hypothetical protein
MALSSLTSSHVTSTINFNSDFGSLSGYILEEDMTPLFDARILISCGENTFECYSNESGFYHRDDIPIVFCIWNISVYKEGYNNAYCEMSIGKNSTCNFTLTPIEIIGLAVEILPGLSFPSPLIRIENIGNSIINNVELTDIVIEGNILYNNRDVNVAAILEPGEVKIINLNSLMIGFGVFTINVVVTCDQGEFVSDETNGLIIGLIILIP